MIFAKPGLSEFHESSTEKNNFLEPEFFFLQSHACACMIFLRLVRRKPFFWSLKNCLFAKPSFSEFHQSSVVKINFLEPEKLFFAKPCLYEFFEVSAQKTIFWSLKNCFFFQSRASLSFKRAVLEKTIFRSLKNCFSAEPGLFELQRIARKKNKTFL